LNFKKEPEISLSLDELIDVHLKPLEDENFSDILEKPLLQKRLFLYQWFEVNKQAIIENCKNPSKLIDFCWNPLPL